jgi:hypothetical protein
MSKRALLCLGPMLALFLLVACHVGGGFYLAASDEPANTAIVPQLDRCTLQFDGKTLKPSRSQAPWRQEYLAGNLRLVLEQRKALAVQADGKTKWTAESPDGKQLYWLAGDQSVAYLGGYQQDTKGRSEQLDSPPRVRRLDLTSGKWLADLPIGPDEKPVAKQTESVLSVLAGNKHVVVLSTSVYSEDDSDKAGQLASYRVTCFKKGEPKSLWSKSFRSAGTKKREGAILLSAARWPNSASSRVQHLSWLGDALLVCAGEMQHILCLERDTGQGRWWVDHIWQKERGFIGPSVWQHTLGGSREGSPGEANKKKEGPELFKGETDTGIRGAVIGGPVVVPILDTDGEEKSHHIFVAASRTRATRYADYLAQGTVYELDETGSFLSTANLPRLVQGERFHALPDGLVWACQQDALVKLAPSKHRGFIGMGPGGPDLITRIVWYRQMETDEPDAWLRSDKAGDPIAFTEKWAFRPLIGGYVLDESKPVYYFPISVIDLRTGLDRTMTLHVPFEGKLPKPTTNYSGFNRPSGKSGIHTMGPYIMAITQLRVEGKTLRVTLAMEKWSAVADFDVDELLKSESKK